MKYDYLIVGAGLFGSVCAHELKKAGKKVIVVEKRDHIGGNCYTEEIDGIRVHKYGAHIFHTSDQRIWDYVNAFVDFLPFINSPMANYRGKLYAMPFNMNTFYALWGVTTPEEAKAKIAEQRVACEVRENVEQQALYLVGKDIYETLIRGYTEKQWGKPCTQLPASIIMRLPLRFTFDNNYFNDRYQGIPSGGYTKLFEGLLDGIDVRLSTDFLADKEGLSGLAEHVVYTGTIDSYYDECFGALEYRSLRFETERLAVENYQGNAVINYTEREIPYTRIIEHKHFEKGTQPTTVITREYPLTWHKGEEPYYPVNNERNDALYRRYAELARADGKVIFGGRLGSYKYLNMDEVIRRALDLCAAL